MSDDLGPRTRRNAPDALQPLPGHETHGAWSYRVRQRFADERTADGKALARVMKSLREDCGPDLNAAQCILLDRIKEKMMVLMKIGEYCDQQISLVTKKGELLPVLKNSYLQYSRALNRDVAALYEFSKRERRGQDVYDTWKKELLKDIAK